MKSLLARTERRLPFASFQIANTFVLKLKCSAFIRNTSFTEGASKIEFLFQVSGYCRHSCFSKCWKHWDFTLCPSSTGASTFNPRQYLYRLRFLNKYLMFLEELNELFQENWSKFLTAGYLVFWKQFPAAGYLDTNNITFPIDGA